MHKYYSLFFSVLLFLIACGGDKTPDGIIDKKKMTALLTDVHIIDGNLYRVQQVPDSLYKYGTAKYLAIFKKFHTDSVQFNNSLKYYALHPDVLEGIYDQILIDLKQKGDSLTKLNQQKIAEDNKRITDSLKKLSGIASSPPLNKAPNPKKHLSDKSPKNALPVK